MESNHLLPAYKVGTLTNELSFQINGILFYSYARRYLALADFSAVT